MQSLTFVERRMAEHKDRLVRLAEGATIVEARRFYLGRVHAVESNIDNFMTLG